MSHKAISFTNALFPALIFGILLSMFACNSSDSTHEDNQTDQDTLTVDTTSTDASLPFVVSFKEIDTPSSFPGLQSAVTARIGDKLLCWGGRKSGFHGRTNLKQQFSVKQANDSIWVLDLETFESWRTGIPTSMRSVFLATNAAHFQANGILYTMGGYTVSSAQSKQNDITSDTFMAVDIAAMIQAVLTSGDVSSSILYNFQDSRVQVTGGDLCMMGEYFCLVMGQNYEGTYTPGRNGTYTEEVRFFQIEDDGNGGKTLSDYQTLGDPNFHRRDLNVVPMWLNGRMAVGVYGGVFTSDDSGWAQPIYIFSTADGQFSKLFEDKFDQKSNQYDCAKISFLNLNNQSPELSAMATTFLGGIGLYQYHVAEKRWEEGDQGIPLPFVKVISTSVCSVDLNSPQRQAYEWYQLEPDAPEMPDFLGSNAVFLPDSSRLYQSEDMGENLEIIDYNKLPLGETVANWTLMGWDSSYCTYLRRRDTYFCK